MEEWLESIGLGEYLTAFRRHGIHADELANLTDDDLRELGLTIGQRKHFRLSLNTISGPAQQRAPTLPERRPLTVVFIDLIGSTGLGERLEVEDMLEVIRLYREHCVAAITRYGGSVARFVGDGILAYFCYPVAHENDPERAIRASLEIVNSIGRLASPAGEALAVRIGAATGRVIVSDLLAGGLVDAGTIIGSTPNLAARLQSLALPNGIVISEATHQRTQTLFRCAAEDVRELNGFATPQQFFRVLAEIPASVRSTAQKPARLTPFFDREEEFAALEERWKRVERGEGGTVVIMGEPGIGKSRLVERFLSGWQEGEARIIGLNASPFDADSPLLPLLVYFRALAQFDADDPPATRSRKLWDALAGSTPDRDQSFPVLAEFLGLSDGNDATRSMPPLQLRDRAFAVIVAHFRALAEKAPVCLVTEDAHWLDPTTQEFLAFLSGQTADCRLLLLVTTRDEEGAVARLEPSDTSVTIRLERLGTDDVVRMVQSLLGDQPVPTGIANQIARKTDGVPLYVEEFVRPLMDTPGIVDWSRVELDEAGPAAIPASLHEAFVARLDRAGWAKAIVQTAAVIGRVARRDILAAVSEVSEAELDKAIEALGQAGVLHPEEVAGHPCYAFGHALVRDAAYDSILRDRRRQLHARVADALRKLAPDSVEQQPELLALHLAEGGLAEEAVPYWLQAARRSLTRSALLEAARLLQRGLSVLASLPRTVENIQQRIAFAGLLGPALIALKGPGSAEARDLYAEAYQLCLETSEERQHFPIYWGWWRMARDCRIMKARADALLRRARKSEDPEMLLQAHHCNWASHYDVGNLHGCCEHIDAGLTIYEQGDYRDHAALYGNHDAKVCAHGELSQVYWMQGRLHDAVVAGERSRAWARALQHLGSTAHAMDMALLHQTYRRDYPTVHRLAEELMAFGADHGFADHRAKGLIFRGWAVSMLGEPSRGLELLEFGLDRQKEIGTSEDFPIYYCLHAEALAAAGRPEGAVEEVQQARSESEAMGLKIWLPEVWRTLGDMLVASGSGSDSSAELIYREAARLADEQGAVMLGLRIAMSQARLALASDAPGDALMRLRRVRSLIAQDDASADLRMADELIYNWSTAGRRR